MDAREHHTRGFDRIRDTWQVHLHPMSMGHAVLYVGHRTLESFLGLLLQVAIAKFS